MTSLSYRIAVSDAAGDRHDQILTPEALDFVALLDNTFAEARRELLDARRVRREELNSGERQLDFLAETAAIRAGNWKVVGGKVPSEVVDFAYSMSPTWDNVLDGQLRAGDAVGPRGWHHVEKHVRIDGRPVSASLFDFGMHVYSGPAAPTYALSKLESRGEARVWSDVFAFTEQHLGLPQGSIRCTVRVDTVTALFELDEILHELRDRVVGVDFVQENYVATVIKNFVGRGADFVLPDRAEVTADAPFLRAAHARLAATCQRRGVTLLADVQATPRTVTAEDLLNVPATRGEVTEEGVRANVNAALRYVDAWLRGTGDVDGMDAGTTELARCQVWQWVDQGTKLPDGSAITDELVGGLLDEEVKALGISDDARQVFVETAMGTKLPNFFSTSAYARYLTV